MIFNISDDSLKVRESYKERNLYYKIFAGYLFNEIIDGNEERKSKFFNVLSSVLDLPDQDRFKGKVSDIRNVLSEMNNEVLHVTFDYHSAQIIDDHKKNNRGEMSDILLIAKSHFISIECKFLTDMKFEKDITEVQERINVVSKEIEATPLQVLLMKKEKWDNSKIFANKSGSFYTSFQNEKADIPVVVLFWDELYSIIDKDEVRLYLEKQMARKLND
jgi:hypothetical protein